MPEISLQAYENEIDQTIEQGRYQEALAHLRYVLTQYPHYVDAYYLLGKTMLEADLPGLAADMFRRALSADPEHLLARIGLGLAHERRNDLDAAIWNLVLAFEIDPGNDDIAEELRRMYGQRDGVELEYLPQTRAGLARLYLRGHRPGRAAEELRALLDEEPARPDIMTALAEAYWRNGQLVQASETAQEILDKMPYNCKANLLLGALWVNSGQNEGWVYLRRAQEADPENRMAQRLFGPDSPLEPQKVTLDRLVYDPDALDVDRQSAWFKRLEAASVSVGLSEAPPEMTESEVRLVDITASLESQIEIPDWLRELGTVEEEEELEGGLGWMAEAGVEEEELPPEPEEALAGEEEGLPEGIEELRAALESGAEVDLEKLELEESSAAEWLDELASEELLLELEDAEGTPAWLLELVGEEAPAEEMEVAEAGELEPEGPISPEAEAESETLEWLAGLEGAEEPMAAEAAEAEAAEPEWPSELEAVSEEAEVQIEEGEEELPDWLGELEPQVEAETEEDEELLAWLSQLESGVTEPTEGEAVAEAAEPEEAVVELAAPERAPEGRAPEGVELEELDVVDAEELPDWLAELEPAEAETGAQVVEETPSAEAQEAPSEGEIPDWLKDFQPAAAPAVEAEGVETEEMPEWLREFQPESAAEAETPLEEESADWLSFLEESGEGTVIVEAEREEEGPERGVVSGEEAVAWLESLTVSEEVAAPEAAVEETEVAELEAPETEAEAPPEVEAVAAEASAEALEAEEAPIEEGELLSGDDALAWLESLAAGKEEELRAQAQSESEERVAEILGRKREAPAVEEAATEAEVAEAESEAEESFEAGVEVEEASEVEIPSETVQVTESPAEEGDLLSGDDALAWLESLAAGKEEELRAQAEAESEERVAQILGRKREEHLAAEETVEPDIREPGELEESAEAEEAVEVEAAETWAPEVEAERPPEAETVVVEAPEEAGQAEEEVAEAADEAGDVLSGDAALAWLESLTVGKEEELRAQAEAESRERVDEILGRRRTESVPEAPIAEAPAPEVAEPEIVEAPSAEEEPVSEEEGTYFGWSAFGDEAVEVTEVPPEPEPTLVEEVDLEGAEAGAGEDALEWLEELPPDREEELRSQLEAEGTEQLEAVPERAYFGWSAFGQTPEEAAVEAEPETAGAEVAPVAEEVEEKPGEVEALPEGLESVEETRELEPEAVEAPERPEEPEPVAAGGPVALEEEAKPAEEPVEVEGAARTVALPEEVAAPESAPEAAEAETAEAEETAVAEEAASPEGIAEPQVAAEESEPETAAEAAEPEKAEIEELAAEEEATPLKEIAESQEAVEESEPQTAAEAAEPEKAEIEEPAVEDEVTSPEEIAEPQAAEEEAKPETALEAAEPETTEAEESAVAEEAAPVEEVTESDEIDELRDLVKRKRSDHVSRLKLARMLWQGGEVEEAMDHYSRLIRSSAKTDDVISDLEHYVEARPDEPRVLRTLGDAYMKFGELDRALAIFNRAMDLL